VQTAQVKGAGPKLLLDNITGYVYPRSMLALMGPSGSGKTTLLDLLAGRKPSNLSASGAIKVNGEETKILRQGGIRAAR
jgi:ABC-type multidrug transport system ATPase subunit